MERRVVLVKHVLVLLALTSSTGGGVELVGYTTKESSTARAAGLLALALAGCGLGGLLLALLSLLALTTSVFASSVFEEVHGEVVGLIV